MAVNGDRYEVHGTGYGATDPEERTPYPVPRTTPAGGHHLLVDFWVADAEPLRRAVTWEVRLPEACRSAGATVLGARFHQFEPYGVTGIVLLAESHASVHTWPEAGLVTLDVFTCGALDTAAIVDAVRRWLAPVRERVTAVARGDVAQPESPLARTSETFQTESFSWTEPAPGSNRGGDRGGGPPGRRASEGDLPSLSPGGRGDALSDASLNPPRLGPEADGPGGTQPDLDT